MAKNQSFIIFATLVIVLLGLVWLHTGSLMPPTGPDSIWFHAGLLTLLVGRFIVEYRFPKPNDVFVNCVVVFASTSTLSSPPNEVWWELVRWGALACAISALILAWDPGEEAKRQKSRWRMILYHIVTRLGRAEVIFSIVFILALVSYFDFDEMETKVFAIAWGIFLLISHLDVKKLIENSLPTKHKGRKVIAVAHSFLAPSIVFCRRLGSEKIQTHELVGFCQSFNNDCHSFGMIIGERSSATETRLVVSLLTSNIADAGLNDRSFLVTASEEDQQAIEEKVVNPQSLVQH